MNVDALKSIPRYVFTLLGVIYAVALLVGGIGILAFGALYLVWSAMLAVADLVFVTDHERAVIEQQQAWDAARISYRADLATARDDYGCDDLHVGFTYEPKPETAEEARALAVRLEARAIAKAAYSECIDTAEAAVTKPEILKQPRPRDA